MSGAESDGAESDGAESDGAESDGAESDGAEEEARALEGRLARLADEGGRAIDPPGFRFAEALLERARGLGGGAGARLLGRASERLDLLEAAFLRRREEARAVMRALGEAGLETPEEVQVALDLGDLPEATRVARRHLRPRPAPREAPRRPWLARLREEAATSFQESVGTARATLAVARAADRVPPSAGPYNPQALAVRALLTAEGLSPAYVHALLEELDDLAALEATIAPPSASAKIRSDRKGTESRQPRRRTRT
ncbi:DUF2894 domain-containing protein [Chondromyces apiculatus]|uniref:Uncharacterized protein n=1 Tax=Chondromyces apiculatus DSM 436 TaxID=1192034 RepID=A0A017T1B1_9BACT|nr:DUF2894 domain-containing protein [Chondromyces apiculatus]EYF02356.1 Hypothetical protein CAP_7285 [Chondromyces apiculatus DSM 436]